MDGFALKKNRTIAFYIRIFDVNQIVINRENFENQNLITIEIHKIDFF